jgi:hypothetical protein
MPVTANSPAPYAPASAILDIISRYRSRGLPSPITPEVLSRAGITDSLVPRTSQALKTLDLLDDQDRPTAVLEGLRLASEPEFNQRLTEWLQNAYADILNYVDPAAADETELRDAFRAYNPVGQQPRMVTLFTGLFAGAGLRPPRETNRGRRPRSSNGANGTSGAIRRPPPATVNTTRVVPEDMRPAQPPPPIGTIAAANEYQLVALLHPEMTEEEQGAVWTLIQYLKTRGARTASS